MEKTFDFISPATNSNAPSNLEMIKKSLIGDESAGESAFKPELSGSEDINFITQDQWLQKEKPDKDKFKKGNK